MRECIVKDCRLIGTDSQCKNCPDWDKYEEESIILMCKECSSTHQITPPIRKLEETTEIELTCNNCNYTNTYSYAHIIGVYKL